MDAYAILASLYMAENDGLIGFVPVHRQVCLSAAPEFYFYLRDELIRWSGLTDNDLNDLITWNDVMELSFAEIADQIEKEWV